MIGNVVNWLTLLLAIVSLVLNVMTVHTYRETVKLMKKGKLK